MNQSRSPRNTIMATCYEAFCSLWEEGMNTKPQIYYNNKHARTPQASQMKTICTLENRKVENTHKINKYTEEHTYIRKTRCTRGDARSFFCTYKTYLYAQNEISYEYIQILF